MVINVSRRPILSENRAEYKRLFYGLTLYFGGRRRVNIWNIQSHMAAWSALICFKGPVTW